jgi:hypothetical protein
MRVRSLVIGSAIGTLAALLPMGRLPLAQAATATQSGAWGGGFINVLAGSPTSSTTFLGGGDDSGISSLSTTTENWTTSIKGLWDTTQLTIASIAYRAGGTELYAAYGSNGGGLLKSTDSGQSWSVFASGVTGLKFNGHTPAGVDPPYHGCPCPRATGSLLVLDESGTSLNRIYAGTFGNGIMRLDAATGVWTTIALGAGSSQCSDTNGCYATTLIPGPTGPGTLYVGTHGHGAFKITNPTCSGTNCATVTPIVGSPAITDAEELLFVGTNLFCACGTQGFYRGQSPYTSLTQSNTGLAFDTTFGHTTSYAAIAGISGSSLYLGAYNALCESGDCHTVYRSTNTGSSWTNVTFGQPAGNISTTVAGTAITWWEAVYTTNNLINQANFNAASIKVTSDLHVLVSGHSGVWTTTSDDVHWAPAVQNLGVTIHHDAAIDANDATRADVATTDWESFVSASHLSAGNVIQRNASGTGISVGFSLAVDKQDPSPSTAYLGAGNRDDSTIGDVFSSSDPVTAGWSSTGFTHQRPFGVAVGRALPGDPPTLFATSPTGLWRKVGSNPWESSPVLVIYGSGLDFAPISFPNNLGQVLYTYDRLTGKLWRSSSLGASGTWVNVWSAPAGEFDATTGFMVADPTAAGRVWVTTSGLHGIYKLTGCDVGNCVQATINNTAVTNPGPIAIKPGTSGLFVATRSTSSTLTDVTLLRTTNGGNSWTDLSNAFYKGSAVFPKQLAVAGDGTAYVTTLGDGVIVITGT